MPDLDIDDPVLPTVRRVDPPVSEEVGAPAQPRVLPIAHKQEEARKWLAFALIGVFSLEVIFAIFALKFVAADTVKEILGVIFGPTVALVGSATGFYFGSAKRDDGA